jgi:hypothetical protein
VIDVEWRETDGGPGTRVFWRYQERKIDNPRLTPLPCRDAKGDQQHGGQTQFEQNALHRPPPATLANVIVMPRIGVNNWPIVRPVAFSRSRFGLLSVLSGSGAWRASRMRIRFKSFGANLWARAFLRNCRREMRPLMANARHADQEIRRRAQELFDERVESLPDKQARQILGICSLVLAASEVLEREVAEASAAFDIVRRAFAKTYPGPFTWMVRTWLLLHRDPVGNLLGRSFEALGRRMYGKSMQFTEERRDDSVDMLVTRCAFHQFFIDHGRPELTVLVCAWDRAWMDAIDRSRRPIRTERLSTISTGGECCRFRFARDSEKYQQEPRDVVLVQLASPSGKEHARTDRLRHI